MTTQVHERPRTFLEDEEISRLTGRKVRALQIEQLRVMGVPFFVNALGRAVVARSAVEGQMKAAEPAGPGKPWRSNALRAG